MLASWSGLQSQPRGPAPPHQSPSSFQELTALVLGLSEPESALQLISLHLRVQLAEV